MKMLLGSRSVAIVVSWSTLLAAFTAAEPVCRPTLQDAYDFVVVGGGTAGNAAAAGLARALPNASVLMLDLGRDYSDETIVMDNDEFANAQESPYCEHHFSVEPQLASPGGFARDRNIYTCLSKILGGASSLNYGGWYRAPQSDLDEWATLSGHEGWSYDNMLPFFQGLERVIRDDGVTEQSPDRGYEGIVPVYHYNVSAVYAYLGILPALEEHMNMTVGDQDVNSRDQSGISTLQVSREPDACWTDYDGQELGCAQNVRRGSSYNAFVRDPKLHHGELANLEVVEGAKVVQIDGVTPNDEGDIELQYIHKGWRYVVYAKNEVLLSAGSWGNPKIAMLSGIGNKEQLESVGVESKIDLPGVGQRFLDHGVLWITAMLNNLQAPDGNATDTIDMTGFSGINNPLPALLADFNTIYMFPKSDDTLEYPDMELMIGTAPAGPTSALLLTRLYQNKGTSGQGGSLTLRSDDPDMEMDVSRNWYADDESIAPMLKSLRKVLAMIQSLDAGTPMILEPNAFTLDFTDDEAMKKYIRDNVVSEMHLQGTMKMGKPDDPMAVVDGNLKVIGSNGRLRAADTSTFATELRGHPMATAMAVGMKAADLIASDHGGTTISNVGGEAVTNGETPEVNGDGTGAVNGDGGTAEAASSTRQGSGQCYFAAAAATAAGCAFAALTES